MRPVLILRPHPGADASAARARALGLQPVVAPLFTVRPVPWMAQDGPFDAVLFTSANAPRLGGDGLAPYCACPCFAVGEATADAARAAGFADVRVGPTDGAAVLAQMAEAGIKRALHPCGVDRTPLDSGSIDLVAVPVYSADAVADLPDPAREALTQDALVLLHSPRAASVFAGLVAERNGIDLLAISPAAAEAAGPGWRSVQAAARPRDAALLELAAKLCQGA